MSNMKSKRKNPKTLGESQTLPAMAPDAHRKQGRAALQHPQNVKRAKGWVDEHQS